MNIKQYYQQKIDESYSISYTIIHNKNRLGKITIIGYPISCTESMRSHKARITIGTFKIDEICNNA